MTRKNGDGNTPSPTLDADWRSEAFDIAEIQHPYGLRIVQQALRELDDQDRVTLVRVEDRIRAWEASLDRRIGGAIEQAAEETAAKVFVKIQRELKKVYDRLEVVESAAELSTERASSAEIKAQAAIDTGQYRAVTIVNDIPTPAPPKSTEAPELEKGLRKVVGKKWAKLLAILFGVIFTAVNAWLASRK